MLSAKFWSLVLVSFSGLLIACSTPGRSYTDSSMAETLEIEIMPNTSKMFVYRLRQPDREAGEGLRIERGGFMGSEGRGGGVSIGSSTPKKLEENAGYVVERMGYCKEGFLVIDSSVSRFNLWLKGECKEGATEEDKKRFGAKQTLPVNLKK